MLSPLWKKTGLPMGVNRISTLYSIGDTPMTPKSSRTRHKIVGTDTSQRAPKKSPAQLDREIVQVLGRKRGQAAVTDVAHARRKARAARVTAYRIILTPDELRAVEFARGRYAWPDMLSAHAAEDGAVAFTESEMWQWADDVDSDAEGGHSPFPLASPSLVEKLQDFYDSRV